MYRKKEPQIPLSLLNSSTRYYKYNSSQSSSLFKPEKFHTNLKQKAFGKKNFNVLSGAYLASLFIFATWI
jgi:hypothetical protein